MCGIASAELAQENEGGGIASMESAQAIEDGGIAPPLEPSQPDEEPGAVFYKSKGFAAVDA